MLEQLLIEIRKGETVELASLAARLGTTPQMVKAMLEHLERLGQLQNIPHCETQGCPACPWTGWCSQKLRSGQVWSMRGR